MDTYPLLQPQLGVFLDWLAAPDTTEYNLTYHSILPDTVDVGRLEQAFRQLTEARPALRMGFVQEQGEPRFYIRESVPFSLERKTLDREDQVEEVLRSEFVKPFDLLSGEPLFRFALYTTPEHRHLFVDFSHMVADGKVVLDRMPRHDIPDAYAGRPLEPETESFAESVCREQEILNSESYRQAARLARERFEGMTFGSFAFAQPADTKGRCLRRSSWLEANAFEARCTAAGMQPHHVMMAAFAHLLSRCSRLSDVGFTTHRHGHNDRNGNTYGMYVTTEAVRIRITEGMSVGELVEAVRDDRRFSHSCSDYPFTHLCRDLQLKPGVSFSWQGRDYRETACLDGQEFAWEQLEATTTTEDLGCVVLYHPEIDRYEFRLTASEAFYDGRTLDGLVQALKTLSWQMALNPGAAVAQLDVLDSDQARSLRQVLQGLDTAAEAQLTFAESFCRQAARTPDACAVSDGTDSYTYAELLRVARQIAGRLAAAGITENSFVALMTPRSKVFVAGVLGIHLAGAAYLPIDREYPGQRIGFMLRDSGTRWLLTTQEVLDKRPDLPLEGIRVLLLDESENAYGSFNANENANQNQNQNESTSKNWIEAGTTAEAPDANAGRSEPGNASQSKHAAERFAYMIYTSGSTGQPKGVVIQQRALSNLISFLTRRWELTAGSRISCHSSFAFDASVEDLFPVLTVGGTAFIVPEALRMDTDRLMEWIRANRITGGCYTTQFGLMLAGHYDLPQQYICLGGERLTSNPRTQARVFNTYGPTECCVDATYAQLEPGRAYQDIPIGHPLDNLSAFVMDANGRMLPYGIVGELCLSGPQLAWGYWNRPGLTAEKFRDTVLPDGWQTRIYHSGDLVCLGRDGQLYFRGRTDAQVKLRGFRVEPGETEACLRTYPGIRMAAVQVLSINGVEHLCAWFEADRPIDIPDLQHRLEESLADYMVPTVFTQVDRMPLLASDKIDLKALPQPSLDVHFTAPEGEREIAIAQAMAEVLHTHSAVGADDSFISLGGDSIRSIRLVSLLREKGLEVSVSQILKLKTVRRIAAAATAFREQTDVSQESWSGPVPDSAIVRWFFDRRFPQPAHFNQAQAFRCRRRADKDALQRSLEKLCAHHDMLRAVVGEQGLYVLPEAEMPAPMLRVTGSESAPASMEQMAQVADQIQASFQLDKGPLLGAALFHLADGDALLLVCHHLVVDGVSWRILSEDLNRIYDSLTRGKEPRLPARTASYRDYATALAQAVGNGLRQEISWWQSTQTALEKCSGTPDDGFGRPFRDLRVWLEKDTAQMLLGRCNQAYHTEVNDLLLTAVARSWHRLSHETDLSVELEGHGREPFSDAPLALERTVGWFTSVYPVVLENIGGSLRTDIRRVKETLRRIPRKGVGYQPLRYLGNCLSPKQAPLCLFNYLGRFEPDAGDFFSFDDSLPIGRIASPANSEGCALQLNCLTTADGRLECWLSYDAARFADNTAQAFADGIVTELRDIVQHTSSVSVPEPTAGDLGCPEWSDSEFEGAMARYQARGIHLDRIYPLSPMQEGILQTCESRPDSPAYRILTRYRLEAVLTEEQWQRAIRRTADCHELLRTCIISNGVSSIRQAVTDRYPSVRMEDVRREADPQAALDGIHDREFHTAFDLEYGPLARLTVVRTGENSCSIIMAVHHLITDAWSSPIVFDTFCRCLCDELDGKTNLPLPDDRGRYENWIRHQQSLDKMPSLDYWGKLLEGYDSVAGIPQYESDRRTGMPDTLAPAGRLEKTFPEALTESLQTLCVRAGVTLNTAIELMWGLLLQTANRQDDVLFAKVVSGRQQETEGLYGLFINAIPVRVGNLDGLTVTQALRKLQDQAAESSAHDHIGLAGILARCGLESSHLPSQLVFENAPVGNVSEFARRLKISKEAYTEANFTRSAVVVFVEDGRLHLVLDFDPAVYSRHTVQKTMEMAASLLENLAAHPKTELNRLPLVSEGESRRLMQLGAGETLAIDTEKTVTDAILEQAVRLPGKTAVVDVDGSYTYRQLAENSLKIAAALIRAGVEPDHFVGLLINRRKEFAAAALGIHRAGAAYMPLDPEYPDERLSFMLRDSQTQVVVSTHRLYDARTDLQALGCRIIYLEDVLQQADIPSEDINRSQPDRMAYMIYTSGSTGQPKGAMLHHRGLWNYTCATIGIDGLRQDDRTGSHRSFSFDSHIEDFYPPLCQGATVFIMPEEIRKDLEAVRRFIVDNRLSGCGFTTALAVMLYQTYDLPLRYLGAAGEKLTGVVSGRNGVKIINGYGPTECHDHISTFCLEDGVEYTNIPIGRPMPNCTCYVMDGNLRLLPEGTAGELCFSGPQVGYGYWKRPELNADRFVSVALPDGSTRRLYRTGDLCRWNTRGLLEYMGRLDGQVKLRGFRIEVGEIEATGLQFPDVIQAVAQVREVHGAPHLVLYYQVTEIVPFDEEALRRHFEQSALADYMRPEFYMRLDTMPSLPNGKVNRKALPQPSVVSEALVLPETDTEKALFSIVAALLGQDGLGVTTNLVSLGLNSIEAMRMGAAISQRFNTPVRSTDIMKAPSIRQLAQVLDSRPREAESQPKSNPLMKRNGSNPLLKRK